MLTNSRLVKALVLATVFGTGGTINAAVIPHLRRSDDYTAEKQSYRCS